MSCDRKKLHEKYSFSHNYMEKMQERNYQHRIQSKMTRTILLAVLTLAIILTIGCGINYQLTCKDIQIELEPGSCNWISPAWYPDDGCGAFDDCAQKMCFEPSLLNESHTIEESWWMRYPPAGIYTKGENICATDNVPFYDSLNPVSVQYDAYVIQGLGITLESYRYFGNANFIITSPGSGPLSVTASADQDDIPFGSSTRLYAAIGGGTGPDFTFSWVPGDALDSPSAQNPNASPTETTEYTVTVSDSAGAFASDTVTVTVSLGVFVSASPYTINIGETSTLNVTAGGGTLPYMYTYETQDGTILAELIDDPFLTVSPLATTTYNVTVTDAAEQTAQVSVQVEVSATPGTYILTVDPTVGTATGIVYTELGISCGTYNGNTGTNCTESYISGWIVYLNAQASSDAVFNGWGGDCDVEYGYLCIVTMNSDKTVTAQFDAPNLVACFTVDPDPPDVWGGQEIWDASCSTGDGPLAYRWEFSIVEYPFISSCFPENCSDFTFEPVLTLLQFGLPYGIGTRLTMLYVQDANGNEATTFVDYPW